MRVRCHLRERRLKQTLSLRDVAARTGLAIGELSMLERGQMLPPDGWIDRLEAVYGGDPFDWYPAGVLHASQHDIRRCPECDQELSPGVRGNTVYHPGCRSRRHG